MAYSWCANGPVRRNLGPAGVFRKVELQSTVKRVGLKMLLQGLEADVGQGGSELSWAM